MFVVLRKFVEWWQRQARSIEEWAFARDRARWPGGGAPRPSRQLIRLLELAASYNDKGIYWRNDSPTQVQQTRQGWQREIDALIPSVGESSLPADLLAALRSGAAVHDDSGRFVEQARCWMSTRRW